MRNHTRLKIDFLVSAVLAGILLLVLRFQPLHEPLVKGRSLAQIKASGELVVLTQNSPITYFVDRDGNEAGPEYDLIQAFADDLQVKVRYVVKDTVSELLAGLLAGEGDVASAGLAITHERQRNFLFGPVYRQVSQQVVCRRGGPWPKNVADLTEIDLAIISGSSYEERIAGLRSEYPALDWRATQGVSAEQLLEQIWTREEDCTVMDSTIVALNQRYYPELRVRFELQGEDALAWAMPMGAHGLQSAAERWFSEFKATGELSGIYERYFGHVELFDYVDTTSYIRRIQQRYPKYQEYFSQAATTYGISEFLLAAQAYQESHWNPRAISPTGVRGIMMLTLPTARAMGVNSRLDAEENILGGARYLAKLKAVLAQDITEPNLTWFALAAYNVGLGHLRDAQELARELGMNPNEWHDMKEVLPLLSDPAYYKTLRYGYARGREPVRYVQQVRRYEQILSQQMQQTIDPLVDEQLTAEENERSPAYNGEPAGL